jgi:hypothetical protein
MRIECDPLCHTPERLQTRACFVNKDSASQEPAEHGTHKCALFRNACILRTSSAALPAHYEEPDSCTVVITISNNLNRNNLNKTGLVNWRDRADGEWRP